MSDAIDGRDPLDCLRCGKRIPKRRREVSEFCSERCSIDQDKDDWESFRQERELEAQDDGVDDAAENTIKIEQPSLTERNLT
jgi:hypothetical protein